MKNKASIPKALNNEYSIVKDLLRCHLNLSSYIEALTTLDSSFNCMGKQVDVFSALRKSSEYVISGQFEEALTSIDSLDAQHLKSPLVQGRRKFILNQLNKRSSLR